MLNKKHRSSCNKNKTKTGSNNNLEYARFESKNLNEATFLIIIFLGNLTEFLNGQVPRKMLQLHKKNIIIYCNPKLDIRSMRKRLRTRTRTRRMREADEYTELMRDSQIHVGRNEVEQLSKKD